MKLFHTSDWHLGRMLYGRSLLEDQRWFLQEVFLPAVERERPACVILAGDVYDRQIAPPEAIRLFDATLARLVELGVKVCIISGNHDGADRMALLKGALRQSGVYFATALEDAFSPVVLEEQGEILQLFLLPYFDTSQAREYLGDDSLRGEGSCFRALVEKLRPLFLPGAGHLLVSHCFAAGSQTSDSESTLFVGGSGQVPPPSSILLTMWRWAIFTVPKRQGSGKVFRLSPKILGRRSPAEKGIYKSGVDGP